LVLSQIFFISTIASLNLCFVERRELLKGYCSRIGLRLFGPHYLSIARYYKQS
jgi:hypothetical protein